MDSNDFSVMKAEDRAVALANEQSIFLNVAKFEQMQRVAIMLSKSDFVPARFKGNVGNCMIALDMAALMNMHVLMLMRTMYVVHGEPGFEGKFTSALINNSGRYTDPLEYEWRGEPGQPEFGCRAYATRKSTNKVVYGPWVDWKMVQAEGWHKPKGSQTSKWMTMPQVMFMYRAASFFGRTNDSDLLMGMKTIEELEDMSKHSELVKLPSGSYGVPDNNDKKQKIDYSATQKPPEPEEKSNVVELKKKPEAEAPAEQPTPPQVPSPQDQQGGERDEFGMPLEHPLAKDNWFMLRSGNPADGTGFGAYLKAHVELFADLTEPAYETMATKYRKIYGRDITELTEVIEDDQSASGDVEKPEVEIQPGHPDLAKPPEQPAMSQQQVLESDAANQLYSLGKKYPAKYKQVVKNQIPVSIEQIFGWMDEINQLVIDDSKGGADNDNEGKW